MNARALIEEGIDLNRGQENLQKILGAKDDNKLSDTQFAQMHAFNDARKRKPRSDKGKPKARKPQPGVLTEVQVAHIDDLVTTMTRLQAEATKAQQASLDAINAYYAYLDELKGTRA